MARPHERAGHPCIPASPLLLLLLINSNISLILPNMSTTEKKYVYLKLGEKASSYHNANLGLTIVNNVPARVEESAFNTELRNKKSDFSKRYGSHIVRINEAEYDELMGIADKALEAAQAKSNTNLRAAINRLRKVYPTEAIAQAVKSELGDEDSGDEKPMSKDELIKAIIEHEDSEFDESDAGKLKKKSLKDLQVIYDSLDDSDEDEDEDED
jgi:hypothetical protein